MSITPYPLCPKILHGKCKKVYRSCISSSIATVTIEVKTIQPTEGIEFKNSTYYFSVKENEPKETIVGEVKVLTGSHLTEVTYSLISHTDLFAVDKTGAIKTLKSLDKEEKETYVVNVEATDSRTPQNTAKTTVLTHRINPTLHTKPSSGLLT